MEDTMFSFTNLSTIISSRKFLIKVILIISVLINASIQQENCKKILWLMGFSWYYPNYHRINEIKFSILTAEKFAPNLQPLIMFESPVDSDDEKNPFLNWLKKHNVIICNLNDTQLMRELKNSKNLEDHNRAIYFRMDVDEYMKQCIDINSNIDRNYAIYTDSDVGIIQDINSCDIPKPRIMSIGGEFQPNTIVNTGVMIYNINTYQKEKELFFNYCRQHNWKAIHWDQELFTGYFGRAKQIDQLPNLYNFKPYWWYIQHKGQTPKIMHFHGPKLGTPCTKCMLNTPQNFMKEKCNMCPQIYQMIWLNLKGHTSLYEHFNEVFEKWVYQNPPYFNQTTQKFVFNDEV